MIRNSQTRAKRADDATKDCVKIARNAIAAQKTKVKKEILKNLWLVLFPA
jgi:hypothetical protein